MIRRALSVLLLCILLLVAAMAVGCTASSEKPQAASFIKGEIPFELERDRVILPVRIGDSRVLRVLFDSGMPFEGVLLFHRELGDSALLADAIHVRVPGAGGGEPTEALMLDSASFFIGDTEFDNQKVVVSQNTATQNFPTDGVLGLTLLGEYDVEFDFDKSVITLHQPGKFEPDDSWESLPMPLRNGIPWLDVAVVVIDGPHIPISTYIDNSSGDAIELLVQDSMKFDLPEDLEVAYLGTGLSGDIYGRRGRITSLRIGSYVLRDVVAAFPEGTVRSKQRGADGILGNAVLRRFNYVISYADTTFYLKPNSSFAEAFE
jgi:hypothetical protein